MRYDRGDLFAGLTLILLALGCFARLVAQPGALLVDGQRPSIDYAQREDVRVLGNDLTYIFLPHYTHVARQVGRFGHLPLWDTLGFAGRPMVGNPQGGLFYLPVWLALAARSPSALGWLTVGHLIWAGFGTYVLSRSFGVGRVASTVASGCFQASPYVLAHTFEGHYPHIWSVCWYPWAFWSFAGLRAGRARGAILLPPILALAFLAGHPQEWYYLTFTLSAWALADARVRAAGRPGRAVLRLSAWGLVVGLSLGLIAVELLPDLAAQGWTLRSGRLGLGRVSRYQVHAINLFQLLSPRALGGPADYFGHDNLWESLLAAGLVPLALAAIAVARHPRRRLVLGWSTLVALAVIFAAGRRLGLYSFLFHLVPGMNRFRVPSRSLFLGALGAAILAGLGVEALQQLAGRPEAWRRLSRWARALALVVVTGLLLILGLARRELGRDPQRPAGWSAPRSHAVDTSSRDPEIVPHRASLAASRVLNDGVFWLALLGTASVLTLGSVPRIDRRFAAVAVGALALFELGLQGYALLRVARPEAFLGPDPISAALAEAATGSPRPFRIRARDILYSDARAFAHGFEKVNINDSFQIQHAADLYQTLYPLLYVLRPPDPDDPMSEAVAQFHREVRQGVLDRLGVAFLVSDHVEPEPSWPLVARGRWDGAEFAIHRNPTALPRAYVVPRAEPSPDETALVLSRFRQNDPRRAVLMPADPLGQDGPRQPFTPAEWASDDPDPALVRVATDAPGLLVVADTWMPGWTATVDGRPAPVFRGNHAQRVVPLTQAGRHEVVLRYEAPGFSPGLAVTTLSGLAWVVLACASIRRRNRVIALPRSYPTPHFWRKGRAKEIVPAGLVETDSASGHNDG